MSRNMSVWGDILRNKQAHALCESPHFKRYERWESGEIAWIFDG